MAEIASTLHCKFGVVSLLRQSLLRQLFLRHSTPTVITPTLIKTPTMHPGLYHHIQTTIG